MMESSYSYLQDNINRIKENIDNACIKSGRINDVSLLAVTKTVSAQIIEQALNFGLTQIGENKVQEMLEKYDDLSKVKHSTHIIGHLQTNKVKFLPSKIDMVQSVDSLKLADTLDKEFAKHNLNCNVLVQVNIGQETNKTGIPFEQAEELCDYVSNLPNLTLKGLMCIPPNCENDKVRKYFEKMYKMFVDIKAKKLDNNNIEILSMGMSQDYEYAIQEGATMVRVGSSLFGKRNYL